VVDLGHDILSLVEFPYPVVPIIRCHHESWDGSRHPWGVSGEDNPVGARILSVVDRFDALTSVRPYRAAMTPAQVFDPATNVLAVAHALGPAAEVLRGLSIPIASKLSGWVAANRQPIVNSDPSLDLGVQAEGAASLQSSLGVPLVNGNALVGALTLYASRPRASPTISAGSWR
jgi:GAF domain-containing protein